MRVLHVCSYYITSKLYKNLIENLAETGIYSRVYIPVSSNEMINKFVGEESDMTEYLYSKCFNKFDRVSFKWKNKKIYSDLNKNVKLDDIDITHAHSLFVNGYVSYRLKKDRGIDYIVAVRNTDVNTFFKKVKHLRPLGVEIMKNAKQVIFLSERYKNDVINEYVPEELREEIFDKSVVIPNGVDSFWLENEIMDEEKAADKDNVKLVFTGKLDKNKNIYTSIDAVKKLNEDGVNATLDLIGDGPEKDGIKKYAEENAPGKVNLLGFMDKTKIIDVYRNSDIFVMPSKFETFGLVYVEALTQGLHLIYTRGQGFDGYFADGTIGYSVKYDDSEEIKNRIKDISSGKVEKISNYKDKILNDFDWKNVAERYKKIYSK